MRRTIAVLLLLIMTGCQAIGPGTFAPGVMDAQGKGSTPTTVSSGDRPDEEAAAGPSGLPVGPAEEIPSKIADPTAPTTPTVTDGGGIAPTPATPTSTPTPYSYTSGPKPADGTPLPAGTPVTNVAPNTLPPDLGTSNPVTPGGGPIMACSTPGCSSPTSVMDPISDGAEVTDPPVADPTDGSEITGGYLFVPKSVINARMISAPTPTTDAR